MITEDYVSFETAKLLKEKGFDIPCNCYMGYSGVNLTYRLCITDKYTNWNKHTDKFIISCPTLQMTMKWLREVHNIFIIIEPHTYDYINEKNSSYVTSLWQGDNYYENITSKDYPTYEEAAEVAIRYCLQNLI